MNRKNRCEYIDEIPAQDTEQIISQLLEEFVEWALQSKVDPEKHPFIVVMSVVNDSIWRLPVLLSVSTAGR